MESKIYMIYYPTHNTFVTSHQHKKHNIYLLECSKHLCGITELLSKPCRPDLIQDIRRVITGDVIRSLGIALGGVFR